MNLRDPLWKANGATNITAAFPPTFSSSNSVAIAANASLFSPAQAEAMIAAISGSGPYLWSFELYWYITIPVTLATILLPLVVKRVIRWTSKFIWHNRYTLRFLVLVLGAIAIGTSASLIPQVPYLIIFGVLLGLPALIMLISSSVSGTHQVLWCGYATVFALSVYNNMILFSIAYLLSAAIGAELRYYTKLGHKLLYSFFEFLKKVALQSLHSHPGRWQVATLFCYLGLDVGLVLFLPWGVYVYLFGVPFGIIAFNRAIRSFASRKRRRFWSVYGLVYTASLTLDILGDPVGLVNAPGDGFIGWTGFVPMLYLYSLWVYAAHKDSIHGKLKRLRIRRPRGSTRPVEP